MLGRTRVLIVIQHDLANRDGKEEGEDEDAGDFCGVTTSPSLVVSPNGLMLEFGAGPDDASVIPKG